MTTKKIMKQSIIFLFCALVILGYCFIKFSEFKYGVFTIVIMVFRLFLASKLKVGFAHVGDIMRFDQMNIIEKMYLSIIGITVFPVWLGFFYMSFTMDKPFLNNEYWMIFILFSTFTVIAIFTDVMLYTIRNKSNEQYK